MMVSRTAAVALIAMIWCQISPSEAQVYEIINVIVSFLFGSVMMFFLEV